MPKPFDVSGIFSDQKGSIPTFDDRFHCQSRFGKLGDTLPPSDEAVFRLNSRQRDATKLSVIVWFGILERVRCNGFYFHQYAHALVATVS